MNPKIRRRVRMMLEVDLMSDGSCQWALHEPDTRKRQSHKKWRRTSFGMHWHPPSDDEMLSLSYPLVPDKFSPDGRQERDGIFSPVDSVIRTLAYAMRICQRWRRITA